MTTGEFRYLDLSTVSEAKPWAKVDGPGWSFELKPYSRSVSNLRTHPDFPHLTTDSAGFSVHETPTSLKASDFAEDTTVRTTYYDEVASILRQNLPAGSKVSHIEIFDHTIRKHDPTSPRQPVQQVHVDQTPRAAAARVRRHLPADQAEKLLRGRYQIINVWRPISHAASDFPLAVIDWRTTSPTDFVKVDLMYPKRPTDSKPTDAASPSSSTTSTSANGSDTDDRGKEALPSPTSHSSLAGYEVRGETLTVSHNPAHVFYYVKDMLPSEAMFIKCFDSRSEWIDDEGYVSGTEANADAAKGWDRTQEVGFGKGRKGVAMGTPHTAFVDPDTPSGVKGRESIEVRCLVFYDD